MKRTLNAILSGVLLTASLLSVAAPYDYIIKQQNSAGSATSERPVPYPGQGVNGLLGWNNLDQKTITWKLGPSFMIVDDVINSATDWDNVTNRPVLSAVATSGDYNDLANKPVIPGAQIQTDWNATGGIASILNKPVLADVAKTGSFWSLVDTPQTFPPSMHQQAWGTIQGTPTTLSGYGIVDAASSAQLDTKLTKPTGTTSQYLRGDGSIAAFPTAISAFTNDANYTTQSGARSAITLTTNGTTGQATYNATTGALNIPSYASTPNKVVSYPARTLNTAFQVSATRDADVRYSVQCTVTASIASGQACDIVLEVAGDQAFTQNVQQVGVVGQGQTYSLAVAIQGVQPQTQQIVGYVPAGSWVRIRTVQTTGSPTFSYRAGQEILQ